MPFAILSGEDLENDFLTNSYHVSRTWLTLLFTPVCRTALNTTYGYCGRGNIAMGTIIWECIIKSQAKNIFFADCARKDSSQFVGCNLLIQKCKISQTEENLKLGKDIS